jgi:hypothetical protein
MGEAKQLRAADRLVTLQGIEELKGIADKSTLNRWAATGKIPGCRKIGKAWVIRQSALDAFLSGEKAGK